VGDCSNAVEFRFLTGGAGSNFCAGEMECGYLYNRALSKSQILMLQRELS
jgi:hypothetical protein